MRFEELFNIFYKYCNLELSKGYTFLALINILLNGDADNNQRNRFKELMLKDSDGIPTRLYHQYSTDNDYQVSKFKDVLKRAQPQNMIRFIDGLLDQDKESIDHEIKTEIRFYRNDVSEEQGKERLSVGEGFTRLLMTFIAQRTKKGDLGVSTYFPYESETQAIIDKLPKDKDSYNLFVLQTGESENHQIKLSKLNSPRVDLCVPALKTMGDETWRNHLSSCIGLALFFESQDTYTNKQRGLGIDTPLFGIYAYIGYVEKDPVPLNNENVIIEYKKIGKIALQDLIDKRDVFGITGYVLKSFFFGCHEGYFLNDGICAGADGYWLPEDWELAEGNALPIEIDEFNIPRMALPMWIKKSVNLVDALRLSRIKIEWCE